jgi:predicted TIM-barrel fold metal-dependent hydrolase
MPDLPIIMAHMGGDLWWEGIAAARESPNLYVDPCGTCADADKIGVAVRELGAERMLFGSDYTLFDPAYTLGMIEDADLSAEQRALILYGNAQRLFNL